MKIPLSMGLFAKIDKDDFGIVSKHKWSACISNGMTYARTNIKDEHGKRSAPRLHRFLIGIKGYHVDHRNGDSLDNRRSNLRVCTQSQNIANSQKVRGVSKYKGVCWNKNAKKWMARLVHNYKGHYLGIFKNEEDAGKAYNKKAREMFGEFAYLNKIKSKKVFSSRVIPRTELDKIIKDRKAHR